MDDSARPLRSIENERDNDKDVRNNKSEYELERDRRVAMNNARMEQIGIKRAMENLNETFTKKKKKNSGSKRKRELKREEEEEEEEEIVPARVTRRQAMIDGETVEECESRELAESQKALIDNAKGYGQNKSMKARGNGLEFPNMEEEFPNSAGIFAPFSLKTHRTNGVITILDIGKPLTKSQSELEAFWSRRGCLFHHPYLPGFRAERVFQGKLYTMEISNDHSMSKPLFSVIDKESGKSFVGETPTAPWYDLVTSKRLGTRISGPQYFGFSERMTMAAIACVIDDETLEICKNKGYSCTKKG